VRALRDILIGPAGWSYADRRGRVYPEGAGSKFDTLALVAKYFDTVEINSSFYHPPTPETARSWLGRIAHNPQFVFTAKLYRTFTHERGKATADDEKVFREGIDPLAEAGKLGAVLIQFPWSFRNDREERSYLTELAERFKIIRWSSSCATNHGITRESCRRSKISASVYATSISRCSRIQ